METFIAWFMVLTSSTFLTSSYEIKLLRNSNNYLSCSCVFIPMFCGIFNQVWLFILLGGERVQMFSNCVNVPSFYLSWFLMFQMLILMIQSKRKQRMKWSVHKTKWHLKRIFQLNILTRVFLPFFPLFLAGFTFTDM